MLTGAPLSSLCTTHLDLFAEALLRRLVLVDSGPVPVDRRPLCQAASKGGRGVEDAAGHARRAQGDGRDGAGIERGVEGQPAEYRGRLDRDELFILTFDGSSIDSCAQRMSGEDRNSMKEQYERARKEEQSDLRGQRDSTAMPSESPPLPPPRRSKTSQLASPSRGRAPSDRPQQTHGLQQRPREAWAPWARGRYRF